MTYKSSSLEVIMLLYLLRNRKICLTINKEHTSIRFGHPENELENKVLLSEGAQRLPPPHPLPFFLRNKLIYPVRSLINE